MATTEHTINDAIVESGGLRPDIVIVEPFTIPVAILADGGPLDILRQKLSREPSIRGRKKK